MRAVTQYDNNIVVAVIAFMNSSPNIPYKHVHGSKKEPLIPNSSITVICISKDINPSIDFKQKSSEVLHF